MILIIGLGNPGKKFEKTRHNMGFRIVDEIATNFQFSIFNFQSIFNAKISQGKFRGQKIIIAKPQTFMNESGKAVKKLISNIQNLTSKLWVVHDDIDLPLGKIRIVKNRGSAGHKGVESIIRAINSKNFVRFRIGIKTKNKEKRTINNVEQFVLQKFNKDEEKIIKEVTQKTVEEIEFSLKEGLEKAMAKFNN